MDSINKCKQRNKKYKNWGGCIYNFFRINQISNLSLALFTMLLFTLPAQAELELHISKTSNDGIPIYIANIAGGANGIIEADLKRSGRFRIVNRSKINNLPPFGGSTNAGAYQSIAEYLVRGKQSADGGLSVELISTSDNSVTRYNISPNNNRRRVAHKAADSIYEKITREKGAFDTRLSYVTVTNKASKNRTFRLYVADSDGYNPQSILSSRQPIMSPAWSPDAREIAYVSFERNSSAVYVQNIFTGKKRLISAREGINGAPAWSPDGSRIALSLSINGDPDIYTIHVKNGTLTRVTNSDSIDTEPVWSGTNSIIFTSNRGGSPQLYRVSATGGKAQRLTFDSKYNSAADVASNKMAFITGNRGAFHIAIKSVGGSGKDMLSSGRLDESPTIAPNGAMVAYTTLRNGENTLAVVSDNAKARQFLTSPAGDIREPAWSPYLSK